MELLYVLREWLYGEGEELKTFHLEELLTMQKLLAMNSEEFSEFITGYNCDTYADTSCDIMEEVWCEGSATSYEELYDTCMCSESFKTLYTVYRLWNSHLTEAEALNSWRESCLATMEGLELEEE